MIEALDERPHEAGGEPTWSESYYSAWSSPERSGFARIANRPNEGTQDVLVGVYDGDGAITLARHQREERGNTERLDVGGVRCECEAPLERWRLTCDADAIRLPAPRVLLGEDGAAPVPTRLRLDLAFAAEQPAAETETNGPEALVELVRQVAMGHFEQSGTMSGTIDGQPFSGRGYRDKSW